MIDESFAPDDIANWTARLLPYRNHLPPMRDVVVSGALPRVQLVTPAIVDKTIARYGVRGLLTHDERATLDAFVVALCR